MELTFTLTILLVLGVIAHGDAAGCTVEGTTYAVDQVFQHPANNCSVCECCADNWHTCVITSCPEAECGRLKQQNTSDGCCLECKPECDNANCTQLNCPSRVAYPPDSCCGQCGCNLAGTNWPMEVVAPGPFGACGRCMCYENGTYSCTDSTCPSQLLECVDPTATKNGTTCTLTCNNGITCRRSNNLLKQYKFTKIGYNSCTCVPNNWFPRGGCIYTKYPNPAALHAVGNLCMSNVTVDDLPHEPFSVIHYDEFFSH